MIDLNTGMMQFNGIDICKDMKISDFIKYSEDKVHINNRGNGRGIVRLKQMIISNGIAAQAKIEINEMQNIFRISLMPDLGEFNDLDLLSASKKWLYGIAPAKTYKETDNSIIAKFSWGYIYAQYLPDRDYGKRGGEINIVYEGER